MSRTAQQPTRALLACGAVAGPWFIVVVLIQDFTRAGFDPSQHPLSLLSLGERGWIQTTNFVVTGLLNLAFAAGLWRLPQSGLAGRWGPLLIAGYGLALVWVGVFVTDPASGYPPGVPEPAEPSWHGRLHDAGALVAFGCLVAASWVFARRFAVQGVRGWALTCAVTGLAVLAFLVLGGVDQDHKALFARAAAFLGWGWASALAAQLRKTVRST